MKKIVNKRILVGVSIFILGVILSRFLLTESTTQFIYMFIFLLIGAWTLAKGMKITGFPQLFVAIAMPAMPVVVKLLAQSSFAVQVNRLFNFIIVFLCDKAGIATYDFRIGHETSIILTFYILLIIILFVESRMDHTAMKIKRGSDEEEFKQKNYAQKCEMFCKVLRQRLESINRETNWNESLFTPIEAEVEVNIKGKHKKKYDDLLRCLKSVKHKGEIFLVLGNPGAGKSVSLRKLCLELLDESKKTKKIPVYINLKKWNRDWDLNHLPNRKDLIAFIKDTLYEDGDFSTDEFLKTYFDKMLEDGRWYFIFDSFDEMPCLMGKKNCQELIDKISELLYCFLTTANQNGGIIASRMYKAPSEAIGAAVVLKLQEFSDIKIRFMLQKYLNNAAAVIKELFGKREDLVVLCRNPFYLTLLINYVNDNSLRFPQNQMELYQNFLEGRLEKCSGKLESENITVEAVHKAARELAVFMQESATYGLECPIAALHQNNGKEEWHKVLKMLEYAKICRFGGKEEVVSFVHRRFQEFFLVEDMIENQQTIGDREYKSIVNNSHMRDALVLYCEVIEEQKAREIARFCWNTIRKNIAYVKNILEAGSMELVNTIYFMTEAFRNRKEAIEGFREDYEQLVEKNINERTDFVILLAFTNSMVLFEQNYLQRMVLKVFQLRNRWLNDVIIQNCRMINQLDIHIERQFMNYFFKMDMRTFVGRFRNVWFSLSLNKNFRYIRLVNGVRFLFEILSIVFVLMSGLFVLLHLEQFFMQFMEWFGSIDIKQIDISEIWSMDIQLSSGNWVRTIAILFCVLLIRIIAMFCKADALFWKYFIAVSLLSIICTAEEESALAYIYMFGWVFAIPFTGIVIHYIYALFKQNKVTDFFRILSSWSKKIFICLIIIIITCIIPLVLYFLWEIALIQVILKVFCIIMVFIYIVFLLGVALMWMKWSFADWRWIKRQPNCRSITREKLAINLEHFTSKRYRYAYSEFLLQNKVELTGQWPDGSRPKYSDDRLELNLAKLDCATLESANYLF